MAGVPWKSFDSIVICDTQRKHFLFAQETASSPGGAWVGFLSQNLIDLKRKSEQCRSLCFFQQPPYLTPNLTTSLLSFSLECRVSTLQTWLPRLGRDPACLLHGHLVCCRLRPQGLFLCLCEGEGRGSMRVSEEPLLSLSTSQLSTAVS